MAAENTADVRSCHVNKLDAGPICSACPGGQHLQPARTRAHFRRGHFVQACSGSDPWRPSSSRQLQIPIRTHNRPSWLRTARATASTLSTLCCSRSGGRPRTRTCSLWTCPCGAARRPKCRHATPASECASG